jgi:hypothetical protein
MKTNKIPGVPLSEYTGGRFPALTAARQEKARTLGAVAIFDSVRYALNVYDLPAPTRHALEAANCTAVRVGSTTFKSSTWAVIPR